MERFFQIRDAWGNGITLWIVVLLLMTLPILGVMIKDVNLENDVTKWLPSDDPDAKALAWFSDQFEKEDRIIITWDSSTLDDPRLEKFANALTPAGNNAIPGVRSVSTPTSVLRMMIDNNVPREEAIDRLTGVLIGTGFLKIHLTEFGRSQRETVQSLAHDTISQLIDDDQVEILPKSISFLQPVKKPAAGGDSEQEPIAFSFPDHDFQIRWKEISSHAPITAKIRHAIQDLKIDGNAVVDSTFFAAGSPVAVTIALEMEDDQELHRSLDAIEAAAVAVGVPREEIRMAGSPVSRARLNQEAARAVWNQDYPIWNLYKRTPIILSAVVGVFISFVLLRSVRLALLVAISSVYTCLIVVAMIPLTGKSLNMVLIVLPDLMLVLTTSGAIHVANYWKHAVMHEERHPIASAVKMAWQPCVLASLTTAIGMVSLVTAVLQPVREFGFYSSIGCLVSLFMILIGFPSLLSIWPGDHGKYSEHADQDATFWGKLAKSLLRHRVIVSVTCLVVFAFSIFGLRWFQTETKVIRYFPGHLRIAQDYHYLEEGLSGIVPLDAVVYFRSETLEDRNIDQRIEVVRKVEEKMAEHRWVSGTLSLADFRDPFAVPSEKASGSARIKYNRSLQLKEKKIFEDADQSIQEFARKASEPLDLQLPGGRDVHVQDGDEIWRIRAQSVVTGDIDYSALTTELNNIIQGTLADEPDVHFMVTGMVPLFLRTQEAVLESLIKSFGIAFLVIAVVMMGLLRSFTSGLLAMVPNLFPVGVVFGIVSWLGVPVDIGTMITASVALGIAVDGTLHLLTWYQDGIRHGMSRHDAIVLGLQHCGPAMWQTSASIALGIVMVSGADLLLISRFGLLMAGLVMAALIADVVLLPTLLAGWLGVIIERNCKRSASVPTQEQETIEFPRKERVTDSDSRPAHPHHTSSRGK